MTLEKSPIIEFDEKMDKEVKENVSATRFFAKWLLVPTVPLILYAFLSEVGGLLRIAFFYLLRMCLMQLSLCSTISALSKKTTVGSSIKKEKILHNFFSGKYSLHCLSLFQGVVARRWFCYFYLYQRL